MALHSLLSRWKVLVGECSTNKNMLYVLYGDDNLKLREKYRTMLEAILLKKPELTVLKVDASNILGGGLDELVSVQGLFEKQYVVLLDMLLKDEAVKTTLLTKVLELADSKNIFILIENEIEKEVVVSLSSATKHLQEFKLGMVSNKEIFNTFLLTDALGRRDRGGLWVLYQKALGAGISVEAIHPLLFWQIKSLLLVAETKAGESTGMKPYPEGKTKQFLKNYTIDELKGLSRKLVVVYGNARRGVEDFEVGLERFMLTL